MYQNVPEELWIEGENRAKIVGISIVRKIGKIDKSKMEKLFHWSGKSLCWRFGVAKFANFTPLKVPITKAPDRNTQMLLSFAIDESPSSHYRKIVLNLLFTCRLISSRVNQKPTQHEHHEKAEGWTQLPLQHERDERWRIPKPTRIDAPQEAVQRVHSPKRPSLGAGARQQVVQHAAAVL